MKYLQKFLNVGANEFRQILKKHTNGDPEQILNYKLNDLDPLDQRKVRVLGAALSVLRAYESMQKSLRYIQVTSLRPKDIKREEHIKYHDEAFIQSTYIFKEKLKLVIPQILKLDNKWISREKKQIYKKICQTIDKAFANFDYIRGVHVHDFKSIKGATLSQTQLFSMLSDLVSQETYSLPHEAYLILLKKEKRKEIEKNLEEFEKVSEAFFKELCNSFTKSNKFLFPE